MWNRDPFVGDGSRIRELGECRALIIGAGGIGTEIARRLSALGAQCTGIRRRPERGAPDGFGRVLGLEALDSLLPSADVLIIAAPATGATRGLVTAERLDHLPQGAIVVNVARGTLLDERALASACGMGALRSGARRVERDRCVGQRSVKVLGCCSQRTCRDVAPLILAARTGLFTDNGRAWRRDVPLRNVVDQLAGSAEWRGHGEDHKAAVERRVRPHIKAGEFFARAVDGDSFRSPAGLTPDPRMPSRSD